MWASSISFLYGIGVLQTPPLKFLTLMIDFDVFPSCRERFASAEAAHHRNDLVDDLPGVGVLCAAHTANQLQSGVVLDVAIAERSLRLELPSSVYQSLLVHRNPGVQLDSIVDRSHGVVRVGLDYHSFPLGNHPYEEL